MATQKLKHPIMLFNIDGTENKDGSIAEIAILQMQIGDHMEKVAFSITDIALQGHTEMRSDKAQSKDVK